MTKDHLGKRHPDFAQSLNNLAALYRAMGDDAAALPPARQALEVTRAPWASHHPHFTAYFNDLAGLYNALGDSPGGLAQAPFVWEFLETRFDMELLGGFIGVAQDPGQTHQKTTGIPVFFLLT